jgi:hypothetical protein
MAGKLKPLDVERKIRPGKSLYEPSGVNPCPRPDWASQNAWLWNDRSWREAAVSLREVSPIHHQYMSGNHRSCRARKKQNSCGDLLGFGEAPQRSKVFNSSNQFRL